MIFDSLVLENFGAYGGGCQEAVLTPELGKPIILFGGMNGSGKTTILDAIQLALYGSRARVSNRNHLSYKDYLSACINRECDPAEGAGITLRFHQRIQGEIHHFELVRRWRLEDKGIRETLRIFFDGDFDSIYTEHWDEIIESYLPNKIAHLFFFDGEQVKDLAEGRSSREILGSAIFSLMGLDLVDRLNSDLILLEKRKRLSLVDSDIATKIKQAEEALHQADQEEEAILIQEGRLVNDLGRILKELKEKEEEFALEGGDLYLRINEVQELLKDSRVEKKNIELQLRELLAGPLPLQLVDQLLYDAELRCKKDFDVRQARAIYCSLEQRVNDIIKLLNQENIPQETIIKVQCKLEDDLKLQRSLGQEPVIFDTDAISSGYFTNIRQVIIPESREKARVLVGCLDSLDEKITRLEQDLDRVPIAARIDSIKTEVDKLSHAHEMKLKDIESLRENLLVVKRRKEDLNKTLSQLLEDELDSRLLNEDSQRMIRHSQKVRRTLGQLKLNIISKKVHRIESLMFESFQSLLRKKTLITGLKINPETFEFSLIDHVGGILHVDRLSSGERQLLATSMLWGLARASGRPIPTIIDTPLGRLDSSHRKNLIEGYFPNASHQVILLSTDEEINGESFNALNPHITRSYLLSHGSNDNKTTIKPGYF